MAERVEIARDVDELTPGRIALRRELHRHPELAFEEVWTAATLARRMRALGLAVHEGVGGTGVVAVAMTPMPRSSPESPRGSYAIASRSPAAWRSFSSRRTNPCAAPSE